MISLLWKSTLESGSDDADRHIAALMERYKSLPAKVARKHLKAAMRRVLKPAIPVLRRNTPPLDTRRGRRKKGEKKRSSGDLRRSVTVKTSVKGVGVVSGVVGYKASFQSRKAIWLQFGTRSGVRPYAMVEKTLSEFGPFAASRLAEEMAKALEKAAADRGGPAQ